MRRTVPVTIDNGSHETTFEVVGDFCAGRKAKLYGPPEDCYPAEDPTFDVESCWLIVPRGRVNLDDMPGGMVNEAFFTLLRERAFDKLTDEPPEVLGREFEYDDQLEF